MTLSLPEDAEPYGTDWTQSGCYALLLSKPDDPEDAWDARYDSRPPWFKDFADAGRVVYCGAAKNVMARLEDHKQGEKRLTVLTRICDIQGLLDITYYESAEQAFQDEWNYATRWSRPSTDEFVLTDGESV